jgi:hypothetical protein
MPNPDDGKQGAKPGSERHRDEQRQDRGPVYHGRDWKDADEKPTREALREPAEDEGTSPLDQADEQLDDPGTRGANFGRGGVGLVERDDERSDAADPTHDRKSGR